ncbi:MAG: LamG domain-containing protein, partial [Cyanobacteria bacterium P01_F01_bin.86]
MVDSTTNVINASSARQSILYFAGSNTYVDLGSKIDLANQNFTIELWDRRLSWGQHSLLGQAKDLHIGYNAESHLFFQTQGSTLTAPKAYDNDYAWHHWAVTFDHDTKVRIIYLNGFPLIDDVAKVPYTGTGALSLGPNSQTASRNTGGHMADVRIWHYVRSQDEIQQARFRRLNGDESGLLGYWPLDEGQGETAHDRTSHGNHGKINAPHW